MTWGPFRRFSPKISLKIATHCYLRGKDYGHCISFMLVNLVEMACGSKSIACSQAVPLAEMTVRNGEDNFAITVNNSTEVLSWFDDEGA